MLKRREVDLPLNKLNSKKTQNKEMISVLLMKIGMFIEESRKMVILKMKRMTKQFLMSLKSKLQNLIPSLPIYSITLETSLLLRITKLDSGVIDTEARKYYSNHLLLDWKMLAWVKFLRT